MFSLILLNFFFSFKIIKCMEFTHNTKKNLEGKLMFYKMGWMLCVAVLNEFISRMKGNTVEMIILQIILMAGNVVDSLQIPNVFRNFMGKIHFNAINTVTNCVYGIFCKLGEIIEKCMCLRSKHTSSIENWNS